MEIRHILGIIGVLGATLTSCASDDGKEIVFREATLHSLTDLIDHIRIVRLEHRDSILIGPEPMVIQRDSSFYVVDRRRQQKIYRFHLSGHYQNIVGEVGSGPGEYSTIQDVFIEEDKDDVYVLSTPYYIYRYAKNGVFKDRISSPQGAIQSFIRQDSCFWRRDIQPVRKVPNLFKTDSLLTVTDTVWGVKSTAEDKDINYVAAHCFNRMMDKTYCWASPYPVVYDLTSGQVSEKVRFRFDSWKYASVEDLERFELKELYKMRMLQYIMHCWESDSYFIVNFLCLRGGKRDDLEYHYIYAVQNKRTGAWDWTDAKYLSDSYQGQHWYAGRVNEMTKDGALVGYLPALEALRAFEQVKGLVVNPEVLENVDEDMDIFLFLCYLK